LRKHALARPGLSTAHAPEILPLFSRLSAGDQDRIFKPSGGQRRIVLATNVAETSLTVPGIRYVIDTGLARVKRYSYRNKVEQLQVEKISQAAARQRAGRCGRVAAGVCIRLYDEADFNARPPFTDPEILRSSLAGVILRMKSLRLTDVESFPFIEPPPAKAISDGYALLQELGALDDDNKLTKVGEALAKLPLDPRIGRMLVAARDLGCLSEVLIIAAGLSTQDPRERPQERQQAADEKHKLFADEKSEFLSWVKLWAWFQNAVEHKKSNKRWSIPATPISCPTCACANGARCMASCTRWSPNWAGRKTRFPAPTTPSTWRCCPGCWATSAASRTNPATTSARAASAT
jgi:ATP-dependent helicase HrpA